MGTLDLNKTQLTDYSGLDAYEIDTKEIDGISDQKETEWMNTKWTQYWGYFNTVPELKNAIILKAIWSVGKGWTADNYTTNQLKLISGWGKDTFKNILFNMEIIKRVGGDAFAEVIRDNKNRLLNLKVLNPGSIKIIVDGKGIIKRYEQVNKGGQRETIKKFKPTEILHMCHNRFGDQIHGISDIESLEPVILAEQQSFENMNKIQNFQAKPFIIFKLKTDDEVKIQQFADKIRDVRKLGEDMFIPDDENLVSWEAVTVNPSQILLLWRDDLRNKFYRAIGLPQIVPGGAGQSTESESKVIYVAFEQIVKHEQLDIEEQILGQLGIEIKLEHPTLIEDLLGVDEQKDGAGAFNIQKGEMTPGRNE